MDRVFSEKTHRRMRKAQSLIFASIAAWSTFTGVLDLGVAGAVVTAILGAAGVFVTHLVENDSDNYFSTKTIVTKIMPDKKPEE